MRSGEGDYRPTGNRTLWLSGLDVPDDLWASFQIPIGLAFFMESTVTGCIVAMYPSPAGATESELHFESWNRMRELNPVLGTLEPDIEGLIANRLCGSAELRDRADRPLLRPDRDDQGRLGGHLGRRRGAGGRRRASSRTCARRPGHDGSRPRPRSGGRGALTQPPDVEFTVLGARPVKYAAAPMLALDLQVTETRGRQVYMLALTIQLMIEPARRAYDEVAHERLVELFGAPERWAVTTRSLVWSTLDVVVPAFTGRTTVTVPIACHYDLELAAAKYLHSLTDGEAPLALHFNGMVYYPGEDGGLQIVLLPWSNSIGFRMPVRVWHETIEHYYPGTAWVGLRSQTLEALQRAKLARGLATLDDTVTALLGDGRDG